MHSTGPLGGRLCMILGGSAAAGSSGNEYKQKFPYNSIPAAEYKYFYRISK